MLRVKPDLSQLHSLIDSVSEFPITSEELVELAFEENAPSSVIDFYRSFPSDEVFEDKEDLTARSEHLALMHDQGHDQPREYWLAPEED